MRVNINDPSFNVFLTNVTNNILSHVVVDNYFKLTKNKKINSQYITIKIIKNLIPEKLSDTELKNFISILCKKNEENENYEFASLLKDMITNFDVMNKDISIQKKQSKPIIKNNDT